MINSAQIYLFFFILLCFSCKQKRLRPDVSNINVQISIERFDQELARAKPENVPAENRLWMKKYGVFYSDFMRYMLEVSDPSDTLYMNEVLPKIFSKKEFKDLANAVEQKFPDLREQEAGLTTSFKYIKYYFPKSEIPRFISFFSGFSVQAPIGKDYIGIGLDMFLGANSPFYPALIKSVPLYISRRFTPENIVPRITEAYLREEIFPENNLDENTLQQMIYQGKILYALDQVLPENTPDSLKIGYTAQQMEWANHYQSDIWSYFLQENLLYNTDYLRIQKYFTEAPLTPQLGDHNESAPKLGSFIGWQIVRQYMQRHPQLTLPDLLKMTNAQQLLNDSKYKGGK